MATRPSGLRQPSNLRSSNNNLSTSGGAETPAPPKPPGGASALPVMSRLPSANSIRRKITTPIGIQPPGSRDSGLATDTDNYLIGDTVYVSGDPTKRGKICFIGQVDFAKGDFAGIILDLPIGNHDGMVQGKRYFQCSPNHGLFTKLSRLTRDPGVGSPSTPRAPQSHVSSQVASPDPMVSSAISNVERTPSPSPAKSGSPAINSTAPSIGERVIVASATGGTKIGILRYQGATDFAAGEWAGVELLTPMGKNNGTVGGKTYFTCKERHGLFVPASKVISSPVNKTPRRHGSRESLISVSSLASSAASRSIRRPLMRESQCLPTCSLQAVLAEKEKHMERLIKERELDRVDLGTLSRQYEEKVLEVKKLQADCSMYMQTARTSAGDLEKITELQNSLEEEHRKLEDLQYTLDEEKIMKADLQVQLDSLTSKMSREAVTTSEATRIEFEAHAKEIAELTTKLATQEAATQQANSKLESAQMQIQNFEASMQELKLNLTTLSTELQAAKEERKKQGDVSEQEIIALKKAAAEQLECTSKLNSQLCDRKRREEELKDKLQKVEQEYEVVYKQKCSLEAEVMDLVNSKSDASELLSTKVNDLNAELQDLRAKLQSTEEDKAVVRRINAEFKTRLAQHEQSEAALKKELEETQIKLSKEKEELEQRLTEQSGTVEVEQEKLQAAIQNKDEELAALREQVSKLEAALSDQKMSTETLGKELESMKESVGQMTSQLADKDKFIKEFEAEKVALDSATQEKEIDLTRKNSDLSAQVRELADQLSFTTDESSVLKAEIEALQSKLKLLESSKQEYEIKMKGFEEESVSLRQKNEQDCSALENLNRTVETLLKDKAALKEQLGFMKSDSSRFQEVEKGLSLELANLRNKLEQKTKMVSDLEQELADKKADLESNKAKLMDANNPHSHVEFLNSIIVDLQNKNGELEIRINALLNGGGVDADANSNRVAGGTSTTRTFQSLRPYCDICEKFDLHDTEDCPAQVSEDNNTHYSAVRGEARPYCESCEIFGHVTGECDDQETY